MKNTIQITSTKNIGLLLAEVKASIVEEGGTFSGNNEKGQFSGKTILGHIKGEYRVTDKKISIQVTKKPFIVPMSKISTEIKAYFNTA